MKTKTVDTSVSSKILPACTRDFDKIFVETRETMVRKNKDREVEGMHGG